MGQGAWGKLRFWIAVRYKLKFPLLFSRRGGPEYKFRTCSNPYSGTGWLNQCQNQRKSVRSAGNFNHGLHGEHGEEHGFGSGNKF
jgi:hypothetical protein